MVVYADDDIDLKNEYLVLSKENAELRKRLALYDEGYENVREAKMLAQSMEMDKEYISFCNYFLGTNPVDELNRNSYAVEELLKTQLSISKNIKKQFSLYEKYVLLCFLNEKLSNPCGKLLLLLQMTNAERMDRIIDNYLEGKIATSASKEILSFYYNLLEEMANLAKDKNSVWEKFRLCMVEEEEPLNDKERNKREIRNNTIRNFYKKHGEKMFLPENMNILYANLKKDGIKVDNLQYTRIKQIIIMGSNEKDTIDLEDRYWKILKKYYYDLRDKVFLDVSLSEIKKDLRRHNVVSERYSRNEIIRDLKQIRDKCYVGKRR